MSEEYKKELPSQENAANGSKQNPGTPPAVPVDPPERVPDPVGSDSQGIRSQTQGGNPGDGSPAGKGNGKGGKKASGRKRAILFLAVLGGLLVLLLLLNLLDFDAIAERFRDSSEDEAPEHTVQNYPEIWFEIPDYNEDVTKDAEYMDRNRLLCYKSGGESFLITGDPQEHGDLCRFWKTYMDALIAGDSRTLNSLLDQDFVSKLKKRGEFVEGYEKGFAPQKVYNFVAELRETHDLRESGDSEGNFKGYMLYYFDVSYQIKDNNGTFRRDISDEKYTIPLRYTVLERDGDIRIYNQTRIRSVVQQEQEEKGVNIMLFIWIALILASIVAELLTTSLVAVWFIPSGIVSLVLSIIWPDQIVLQIVTYVAVSALLLILTRPLVKRHFQKGAYQPTNADMVIGKIAVVTETIDNLAQTGEVSVAGKRWSARSADGSPIAVDTLVSVQEIQGVKLICAPAPEGAKAE